MSQVAAMKQALEALGKIEEHGNVPGWCEFDTNEDAVNYHEAFNKGMKASTALRAAISEQEKCEPVATVKIVEHLPDELEMLAVFHPPFAVSDGTVLYTHPAPVPAGWQGCGECDCEFPCHDGKERCIRLPKPEEMK
jgi:hypothetical protein